MELGSLYKVHADFLVCGFLKNKIYVNLVNYSFQKAYTITLKDENNLYKNFTTLKDGVEKVGRGLLIERWN